MCSGRTPPPHAPTPALHKNEVISSSKVYSCSVCIRSVVLKLWGVPSQRGITEGWGGARQPGGNFSQLVFSVFDSEDHKGVVNIFKTTTRDGR